jgi:hypothetical protein
MDRSIVFPDRNTLGSGATRCSVLVLVKTLDLGSPNCYHSVTISIPKMSDPHGRFVVVRKKVSNDHHVSQDHL